jgi:hypothetical protein
VARHRMVLAAFLMKTNRPAGAAWSQILDLHLQGGIDARSEACRQDRQDAGARSRGLAQAARGCRISVIS